MMLCDWSNLLLPRSMVLRPKRLINWRMVVWLLSINSPHHSLTIPSSQVVLSECMRPASCKVRAALSPAIPAPTIAICGIVLLLSRSLATYEKGYLVLLLLVLILVLRTGELEDDVGHVIPGVVDADEQKQHRCRGDDEQGRHRIA